MDLDGDGHDDVISGSYWPGDIFVFRGQGGGRFAAGEILKDSDGKNVNGGQAWKSEDDPDMDSLAASPHLADLDGDGDLDLLIGNIAGRVILVPNEGTKTKPAFASAKKRAVEAGGKPVCVDGGDAGPYVCDWDRDGLSDLLVGAGEGAVVWYRNGGTKSAPKFLEGRELVSNVPESDEEESAAAPVRSGRRAKVWVADMNGDRLEDLLIGDFLSLKTPEPELTEDGIRQRDQLKADLEACEKQLDEIRSKQPKLDTKDPAVRAILEKLGAIHKALRPLQGGTEPHGYVWHLRRRAPASAGN